MLFYLVVFNLYVSNLGAANAITDNTVLIPVSLVLQSKCFLHLIHLDKLKLCLDVSNAFSQNFCKSLFHFFFVFFFFKSHFKIVTTSTYLFINSLYKNCFTSSTTWSEYILLQYHIRMTGIIKLSLHVKYPRNVIS